MENWQQHYAELRAKFNARLTELDLGIVARFVPFSQSRHAKPNPRYDERSLNWSVDIKHNGRTIFTTDYTKGMGHCPSYKQGERATIDYADAIKFETEQGKAYRRMSSMGGKRIELDAADVFSSLCMDTDAIDYATYEDYADSMGMEPDSRRGEASYRECLRYALALRAAIGDVALNELRELAREF